MALDPVKVDTKYEPAPGRKPLSERWMSGGEIPAGARVVEADGEPAGGHRPIDGGGMPYSAAVALAEAVNERRERRNARAALIS